MLTFGLHDQLCGSLHVSDGIRGHALVHPSVLFHDAQDLQVGVVDDLNGVKCFLCKPTYVGENSLAYLKVLALHEQLSVLVPLDGGRGDAAHLARQLDVVGHPRPGVLWLLDEGGPHLWLRGTIRLAS